MPDMRDVAALQIQIDQPLGFVQKRPVILKEPAITGDPGNFQVKLLVRLHNGVQLRRIAIFFLDLRQSF
jgi:hypothetical protein